MISRPVDIVSVLGKVKIVKKKLFKRFIWGLGTSRINRSFPKSMKYLIIAKHISFACSPVAETGNSAFRNSRARKG